jgi:mercuric ion binding protein
MMIRPASAVLALGLLATPLAARAADTVAMMNVHNARCELCPLIVKTALGRVKGVEAVEVGPPNSKGDMMAQVMFDDAVTKPADLIKATTDRGYPAEIAQSMSTAMVKEMKPMR